MCTTLYFYATERLAQEVVINAAKAAIPPGGNIFFHESMFALDHTSVPILPTGSIHIEMLRGRLLHIRFERLGDCKWSVEETYPLITHQSWGRKYRSWYDLLASVDGVKIDGNSHRVVSEDSIRWLR